MTYKHTNLCGVLQGTELDFGGGGEEGGKCLAPNWASETALIPVHYVYWNSASVANRNDALEQTLSQLNPVCVCVCVCVSERMIRVLGETMKVL